MDLEDSPPTFSTIALKSSRFSPRLIAGISAPINLTLNFARVPRSLKAIAAFSAVWPPSVARIASGLSISMIFSMYSAVIGSM